MYVARGSNLARRFYKKTGAEHLTDHWLVWKDIKNIISKTRPPNKALIQSGWEEH